MTSILPPENTAFDTGYALSPDGTRLVFFARSVDGKSSLWLRHVDSLVAQELSKTDGGIFPFWSPDSQWIAFFARGKLRKIPAVGGDVQSICDVTVGRGGSWNSQGVIVFAPSFIGPLFRVSANGGTPAQVTQLDSLPPERQRIGTLAFFLTANTFCTLLGRLLKANRTMSMLARLIPPHARKSSREQAMQST